MGQEARIRSGEARFGGLCALVIGAVLLLAGLETAVRQEMEPLSSAESRCGAPANGVDSPAWSACVARESAENGLAAALPTLIPAFGMLAVGAALMAGTAPPLHASRGSADRR